MLVLGRANPHSLGYVSSPFANPSDPCCPVTSGGSGDVCPEGRALHGGSGEGRALHGGSGELCPRDRALHGGSGTVYPQDRASKVPDAVRVAYMHGEHLGRDRALEHRGGFHGDRAHTA